jgi:hypothetical protein
MSRHITGINNIGGKFAMSSTPVANLLPVPLVSLIPVANLPLVSMTLVANNGSDIRLP